MTGSGWNFQTIIYLENEIYKTLGIRGNSYFKLPFRSITLLNIQNENNFCLIWSILAKLYPTDDHVERVSY